MKQVTRDDLAEILDEIVALINKKGTLYGLQNDQFANITHATPVQTGIVDPVVYALMMTSKQDATVWLEVLRAGSSRPPEIQDEWLEDSIAWRLIALAFNRNARKLDEDVDEGEKQ